MEKSKPSQSVTKASGGGKDKKSKEKEAEEAKEKALIELKKAQEKDMPHFENGETTIYTSKDSYELCAELGQGSFGSVYGVMRRSDNVPFALKCESIQLKKAMLPHEVNVLLALSLLKSPHFVEIIDYGTIEGRFLFVVMKCVGKNLWDVRVSLPEKVFTLKTVMKIAEQTLAGLRDLHRVGYLHRDIKPPNFAIGRDTVDFHTIYLLDFGLCRRIAKKGQDLRRPRPNEKVPFRGTTRYASIAAHKYSEQSRKDDIESWWYMIAEMIIIDIPWKQRKGTERMGVLGEKVRLRKSEEYLKFLFRKCCYEQMSSILKYLDSLQYTSIPDYDYMYRQIQAMIIVNKIRVQDPPDWDVDSNRYHGPVYKENQPYIVKELE